MSRISQMFEKLRQERRKALIGYLTVGYPDLETTFQSVISLVTAGCDIIELGIPFSDPLADGTTIQRASFGALQHGVTPGICLEVAAKLRRDIDVPLVFMTYYNPILSYGLDAFCSKCSELGVDGLIVPDLPPDEGVELEEKAARNGIDVIYLLAPTSTEDRIKLVAEKSKGFIYLVSLTGVTGAREALSSEVDEFVSRVRQVTEKPLCIGFGISSPEQAAGMARLADGVIVGSKLIDTIESSDANALRSFVQSLRHAVDE